VNFLLDLFVYKRFDELVEQMDNDQIALIAAIIDYRLLSFKYFLK
jgi:hypothetical protein